MNLSDVPTPGLILDRRRLVANTKAMAARIKAHGTALRPHAKTAKSAKIACLATKSGTRSLAVSTLLEAEYFLDHGFKDLLYAVCIAPDKLDMAAALTNRGADLKIIVDNPVAAAAISLHSEQHQVLLEIDSGEQRTGVPLESSQLLDLARVVHDSGRSRVVGVLTHAGHSYSCQTASEAAKVAEGERRTAVDAAQILREAGYDTSIISVGSTPTAIHGKSFEGVSEVRPGVYMFQDLFQAGIGSCRRDDLALSVLATVISSNSERKTLMLDAGGLALSKDRSTEGTTFDAGYGLVADLRGDFIGDLRVNSVHQEHGQVMVSESKVLEQLPIGSKVRVFPNHACMTAAAYNTYYVIDGDTEVVETWPRCNGWPEKLLIDGV